MLDKTKLIPRRRKSVTEAVVEIKIKCECYLTTDILSWFCCCTYISAVTSTTTYQPGFFELGSYKSVKTSVFVEHVLIMDVDTLVLFMFHVFFSPSEYILVSQSSFRHKLCIRTNPEAANKQILLLTTALCMYLINYI